MFDDLKKRLGLYVDKVMNNTTPTFKTPNAKPQSINQLRVNIPRNISRVAGQVDNAAYNVMKRGSVNNTPTFKTPITQPLSASPTFKKISNIKMPYATPNLKMLPLAFANPALPFQNPTIHKGVSLADMGKFGHEAIRETVRVPLELRQTLTNDTHTYTYNAKDNPLTHFFVGDKPLKHYGDPDRESAQFLRSTGMSEENVRKYAPVLAGESAMLAALVVGPGGQSKFGKPAIESLVKKGVETKLAEAVIKSKTLDDFVKAVGESRLLRKQVQKVIDDPKFVSNSVEEVYQNFRFNRFFRNPKLAEEELQQVQQFQESMQHLPGSTQSKIKRIFSGKTGMEEYDKLLKTGASEAKDKVGRLVYMTPREYLSQVETLKTPSKQSLNYLKKQLVEGKKWDVPILDYTKPDGKGLVFQEGRHRSLLSMDELNLEKIPVFVVNKAGRFNQTMDKAKNVFLPKAGTGDKGFINFGELFGKPKPKTTTQVAKDTLKVERQGVSLKNIIPQKDANGVPNLGAEIDMTLPTEKKLAVAANQVREVLDLQNALRTKSTASQAEAIKKLKETYAGMKMTPEVQAELDSKIAKIMSGEKEQVAFNNRLREVFSQQEIDTLINKVETAKYDDVFEYMNLRNDIRQLFGEGVNGEKLLQNSQVKRLKLLYDEELINALNEPKNRKAARLLAEVFGVQKALRATFDLSATLRQGLFLAARHPKKAAVGFKDELRYWFSESAYNGMMQELMQRPNKAIYDRSGLAIIDPQAADLTKREDVFISHLLEEVPGIGGVIKRSDRAFTGFLTKMRADVMDDYIRMSKEAGIPQTEALYKGFANWINVASGRGGLGILEGAPANALNSVFFSPRLISSRLQLINPYFYYKLGKEDRFILHQALRTWMNLGAMGGTTLTLAKLSGLGDVSLDPRSADFGKVKVNNTRYDIWGGVQQPFVAAWQFASGEKINTTTGKLTKLGEKFSSPTRWDVALNYFRNKLAPGPSMIYSKMEGKTPTGEDFDGIKALIESLHPLIWDDWYDMAQDGNFNRAAMVLPFVGVGTQTYGEQEITRGENILGQPVTELKAKPSLTEKFVSDPIRGFLGRENTLTPTSGQSIKAYVNQLEKMSNEEARGQVIEIARENPELAKKILEEVSNRARGITVDDESLKEKGVADGTRAKAVIDNINKLDTEAERRQYVIELYQKKVITRDVLEQIVEYYSRQ